MQRNRLDNGAPSAKGFRDLDSATLSDIAAQEEEGGVGLDPMRVFQGIRRLLDWIDGSARVSGKIVRLRILRHIVFGGELRLSQSEVAEICGVRRSNICEILHDFYRDFGVREQDRRAAPSAPARERIGPQDASEAVGDRLGKGPPPKQSHICETAGTRQEINITHE